MIRTKLGRTYGLAAVLLSVTASSAVAAVSANEAAQLGSTLTEFGAVKAGSADGSIPAYTGGITTPPAGFTAGGDHYVDPFKDEKPLYTIDSRNASQYESLLTVGDRALLSRYPEFHLDVYPSHRSVAYSPEVIQNTLKNATTAKLSGAIEGDGVSGAASDGYPLAGVPFPIPTNGYEVMWNNNLHFAPVDTKNWGSGWLVGGDGSVSPLPEDKCDYFHSWYDTAGKLRKRSFDSVLGLMCVLTSPPSSAGITFLNFYLPSVEAGGQKVWFYTPGQRRVRVAPEFAYDVPIASYGGVIVWDEIFGFVGRMDRFDFKLVGRKDMIIPYNNFKLTNETTGRQVLGTHTLKPEALRWEKHRVWVVDAVRKPGARHIYSRRTFYIDEDSWCIVATESYDNAGALWRVGNIFTFPSYDTGGVNNDTWNFNDLIKGNYFVINVGRAAPDHYVRGYSSTEDVKMNITPQSIGEGSIR